MVHFWKNTSNSIHTPPQQPITSPFIQALQKILDADENELKQVIHQRIIHLKTTVQFHTTLLQTDRTRLVELWDVLWEIRWIEVEPRRYSHADVKNRVNQVIKELQVAQPELYENIKKNTATIMNAIKELIELLPVQIQSLPLKSSLWLEEKNIVNGAIDNIPVSEIYDRENELYPNHIYVEWGESYKLNRFTNTLHTTVLTNNNDIRRLKEELYGLINPLFEAPIIEWKETKGVNEDAKGMKKYIDIKASSIFIYRSIGNELLRILEKANWEQIEKEEVDFQNKGMSPLPQAMNLVNYIGSITRNRENNYANTNTEPVLEDRLTIDKIKQYEQKSRDIYQRSRVEKVA